MDSTALSGFVGGLWDEQIVPQLTEYIRIPNKSPMFDAQWVEHGHMDRAVALMEAWARAQPIPGMKLEVVRLPGRTPLIFIEIPGKGDDTVLLYGHLDKQPEMTGWSDHLGPWKPVLEGDAVRSRRRRRRLCDLRLARRDHGAAGAGHRAFALRRHDRGLRGIGQLRSAVLRRSSRRAHRQAVADRVPRLGLRQLRAALADDVAARPDRRQSHRQGARRGRAFGRCVRRRRVELPHPAPGAVAPRGRNERHRSSRRSFTSRFRRSASRRPSARPRSSAMRSTRNSRWSTACSRWRAIFPSSC